MPIDVTRISRIHTFDLLRGYFLIVIMLNHLFYYPSGFDLLTGRGFLYVSTAEGFFLISGIILGIVRGRKLLSKPFSVAAKLLLKRSFQLYVTSVVLAFIFTIIGWLFFMDNPGLKQSIAPTTTPIHQLIWELATYQRLYGWADFLRQYAIFIAIAPAALWLLRKGFCYIVLATSLFVWTLFPYSHLSSFMSQPISWQLIFFSGFVIGFHWPQLQSLWHLLSDKRKTIIGSSLFIAAILSALVSALLVFGYKIGGHTGAELSTIHHSIEGHFSKDRLPWPRLLLGAIWFWGLFWVARRYEQVIIQKIGWLLLPLGVNSLYVYTVQAFIVFFMHLLILLPSTMTNSAPWFVNAMLSIMAISLMWLMVRYKLLFRIIPR